MNKNLTVLPEPVYEGSTRKIQATLQDASGTAVPASSLASLTLTLFDVALGSIINSRNAQDVLNKNDVAVDGNGLLTWSMRTADNVIVDATLAAGAYETHRAMFIWTYTSGGTTETTIHIIEFRVLNLLKV